MSVTIKTAITVSLKTAIFRWTAEILRGLLGFSEDYWDSQRTTGIVRGLSEDMLVFPEKY